MFKDLRKVHGVLCIHSSYLCSLKSPPHSEITFSGGSQDPFVSHHSAQVTVFMATWRIALMLVQPLSQVSGKAKHNEEESPTEWYYWERKKNQLTSLRKRQQRWPGNAWEITIFNIILNNKPHTFWGGNTYLFLQWKNPVSNYKIGFAKL